MVRKFIYPAANKQVGNIAQAIYGIVRLRNGV